MFLANYSLEYVVLSHQTGELLREQVFTNWVFPPGILKSGVRSGLGTQEEPGLWWEPAVDPCTLARKHKASVRTHLQERWFFDGKTKDAASPLIATRRPPHPESSMLWPSPPNPKASREHLQTATHTWVDGAKRGPDCEPGCGLARWGPLQRHVPSSKDLVQGSSGIGKQPPHLGKLPTHTGISPGPQHWSFFPFLSELLGMGREMS